MQESGRFLVLSAVIRFLIVWTIFSTGNVLFPAYTQVRSPNQQSKLSVGFTQSLLPSGLSCQSLAKEKNTCGVLVVKAVPSLFVITRIMTVSKNFCYLKPEGAERQGSVIAKFLNRDLFVTVRTKDC